MKTLTQLLFAGLALLAASCSNESDETVINQLTPVRVHVDGFTVEQESLSRVTRAVQDLADYSDVNAVTLAFYKSDDTEAYKSTQAKGDANYGEFSLSLPMGSYTMVVVAYYTNENSVLTLSSSTQASYNVRARETFVYTKAVKISDNNPVDIGATLNRIVSMLTVVSSDGKTDNVSNVRMTFSAGGKDFDPTTGLAITTTGLINTVGNSASAGAKSTSSTMLFLNTDEQDIDVTIETLDADGNTLFKETVNNVPFKRNRVTKLTGRMYTNDAVGGTFKVETDWLDQEEMNF